MQKLARIISGIFNPLVLVVFITAGIVYQETGNLVYSSKWLIVASIFSILFALFIVISIKKGIFSNFDVSTKKQRPLLFLAGAIGTILCIVFVKVTNGSDHLLVSLFVGLLGLGVYQVLVSKIKASVHMGMLTVFVCFFISLFGLIALPLILLLPVVGWARVKEKEHTVPEVIAGFLIGIVFSGILIFLLQ